MKLLRFGPKGSEKPGLQLEDGSRLDASGFGMDWNHDFFADPANLDRLAAWLAANRDSAPRVPEGTRLGSAVARPAS